MKGRSSYRKDEGVQNIVKIMPNSNNATFRNVHRTASYRTTPHGEKAMQRKKEQEEER